jgi:hypothetical protein
MELTVMKKDGNKIKSDHTNFTVIRNMFREEMHTLQKFTSINGQFKQAEKYYDRKSIVLM